MNEMNEIIAGLLNCSLARADNGSNICAKNYLEDLLSKATELQAKVSEIHRERDDASGALNALSSKIYQAIEREAELKRKRISSSQNDDSDGQTTVKKTTFSDMFQRLQHVMGISINCSPERKIFEILFNDVQTTRVCFSYNYKAITLEEMHPTPDNFAAIQTHLRETGDVIGFLSVLRQKLTLPNDCNTGQ